MKKWYVAPFFAVLGGCAAMPAVDDAAQLLIGRAGYVLYDHLRTRQVHRFRQQFCRDLGHIHFGGTGGRFLLRGFLPRLQLG